MKDSNNNNIKNYWEQRASSPGKKNITTNDMWLRELEVKTLTKTLEKMNLPQNASVLDIGCGDGYSTINIAKKFPNVYFYGIDFSESMIRIASSQLQEKVANAKGIKNIKFQVGDVLELSKIFNKRFDVTITDRCLINLKTYEIQRKAISEIAKVTKNRGHYIGIENFLDGQSGMNKAREKVGLSEISVRWHNLFFTENQFKEMIREDFEMIEINNFSSSYYFATRVIYSKMCQIRREEPDYNHEIHQLAINLPHFGNFSPIKCVVLQKKRKKNNSDGKKR